MTRDEDKGEPDTGHFLDPHQRMYASFQQTKLGALRKPDTPRRT
jgi:hypothetical protein